MPQVRIVQASAGSGKTFTLSKRYLELVLKPGLAGDNSYLKNTLAITFTNNAAIEMKNRIIEYLKKISLNTFRDDNEKKAILGGLSVKGERAREAATRVMECIIREYDLFSVRTIDSFINTLLTGSSFKLGRSANFRIEDLFSEYIEYSFDDMIDKAGRDKELYKVFKDFLQQYIYIEGKEGWIARKDILHLLSSLFSIRNIYGGAFKRSSVQNSDIIEKKAEAIKKIFELQKELPLNTNKTFLKGLDKFLENNTETFDMAGLSTFFTYAEIPVNKGGEPSLKAEKIWKEIRDSFRALAEWEMSSRFNCYIDLFDRTESSLKEIARKEDIIFLEELNRIATSLFGEDGVTVDEIFVRLATRFTNYLLDEFQDTSSLQWNNMRMMVEEALSQGGALFLVGDKKQAIYRFRGGDISLFDMINKNYDSLGVEKEVLEVNYRSAEEIVRFNNLIFDPANLKRFLAENPGAIKKGQDDILEKDDIDNIVSVFNASEQKTNRKDKKGYVSVEVVEPKEKLINTVKELLTRMPPGDIAILTRSNVDSELVTNWLLTQRVSVQSDKTLDIRGHFLIKEMRALLKFLDSPIDNIHFSAFILGDIFSRASGLARDEMSAFIFSLNGKKTLDGGKLHIYKEFRKIYPDVWDGYLSEFFKKAGIVPIYEFVVSIISRFNCMKNFPEEQAFIMKFLEFIKTRENRYSGISGFLAFFAEAPLSDLYVNVRAPSSVRVMTIHQAKGLEFGAVILPFLSITVKVGAGKTSAYGEGRVSQSRPFVVRTENEEIKLLYLNKEYAAYSPKVKDEYREEYKLAMTDELTIAYVALTRARNEMYIFIQEKKGTRVNAAASLFPEKPYARGEKEKYFKPEKGSQKDILKIVPARQSDWIELIKEEFVKDAVLSNRRNILRGNICHFMLAMVGATGRSPLRNIDDIICDAANVKFPLSDEIDDCAATVKKVIMNKKLKDYFFPKDAEIFVEKDIISKNGDMRRIDRLVVTEKEVVVIDYKNSRIKNDPLGYAAQVREYKEILTDIYPGRKIKGILVYLEENDVEEV